MSEGPQGTEAKPKKPRKIRIPAKYHAAIGLLATGMSYRQIAKEIDIDPMTITKWKQTVPTFADDLKTATEEYIEDNWVEAKRKDLRQLAEYALINAKAHYEQHLKMKGPEIKLMEVLLKATGVITEFKESFAPSQVFQMVLPGQPEPQAPKPDEAKESL